MLVRAKLRQRSLARCNAEVVVGDQNGQNRIPIEKKSLAVDCVFAQLSACLKLPVPTEAPNQVLVLFSPIH